MQILWTSCIAKLHFTWHSCYSQVACPFPLAELPHTHHKYFITAWDLRFSWQWIHGLWSTWLWHHVILLSGCQHVGETLLTWLQSSTTQDHNSPHYRLSNSCFKEIRLHFNYPCHHPNPVKKVATNVSADIPFFY